MDAIRSTLERAALGEPAHFLNLTLFPLLGPLPGYHRDYLTLRTAVAAGTARVGEVSQGGSVPELQLENTGKEPVLVLEGEELVGAKQNRTANVTMLVPPGARVRVPVTCVEQGRWSYKSAEFRPSEQMHFKSGRASKLDSVSRSMRQSQSRRADQSAVWSEIGAKSSRMRVASPTAAMNDVFEAHHTRIEDYVAAFRPAADQVGAVFAINDRVEGLELFDSPQTLGELLPRLIRSYAIDALEVVGAHRSNPERAHAMAFVEKLRTADVETYPAIGLGTEVRISSRDLIAAGLVVDDRLVHLAAFAPATPGSGDLLDSRGLARTRSRRRGMLR